ncbi:hypothetical protein, partial [Nocardia sp. NPDC058497]|uniref:hypothetical protein n=1 Tax=Nocardia sp. NPDC058497 TaxID=3346529 RepID=UPI0036666633
MSVYIHRRIDAPLFVSLGVTVPAVRFDPDPGGGGGAGGRRVFGRGEALPGATVADFHAALHG